MQAAREPATQELRRELVLRPGCCFIDAPGYRSLLVSKRRLVRSDEPRARLRGVLDPKTRERFLIEEERLFNPAS